MIDLMSNLFNDLTRNLKNIHEYRTQSSKTKKSAKKRNLRRKT